ncbi:universal stress protein [Halovivax gelatinilyticus]|uniref:universal stress protein n=1 Tax=Halovivax gelatinilyticus TaxID=2961597 RepID=UPI0020CA6EFD|nr:universal stress protein [Halovivax gelatinilyticus]
MYETILIPVEAGGRDESAISLGLDLASAFGATVHALTVVPAGTEPAGLDPEAAAELGSVSTEAGEEATATVDERADERGLESTAAVRDGVVYRTVLEYAADHDVDLIVMGARGQTERDKARLGRTTERVISLAEAPVLAVPPGGPTTLDRVVLATDGSDAAERAGEHGLELAAATDARVSVLYVVDSDTYDLNDAPRSIVGLLTEGGENAVEALAAAARDRGLAVDTSVRRGRPDESITAFADDRDALVVVGTSGRGGATDPILGATAERVLRRTTRPILTVN